MQLVCPTPFSATQQLFSQPGQVSSVGLPSGGGGGGRARLACRAYPKGGHEQRVYGQFPFFQADTVLSVMFPPWHSPGP